MSERYADGWTGAVCAQIGAEVADRVFFPLGPTQGALGVRLCWDCPLRQICLTQALTEEEGLRPPDRFGIRGGLTPTQRAALVPSKICPDCGSPVVGNSKRCDQDRAARARALERYRKRQERWAA